jgi:hypothetical protein
MENMELRKIFGTEREQTIGDWRKLHNLELYDALPHRLLFG